MRFEYGFAIVLSIAVLGSGCVDDQNGEAPLDPPPDGNQGINTLPDAPQERPDSAFPPADQGTTDPAQPGGGGLEGDVPAQPAPDSGANLDGGGYFDGAADVEGESAFVEIDATEGADLRPSGDTSGGDRYADILPQDPDVETEVELPDLSDESE
ncbi:MAG: hypothetical protein WD030_00025 [Pirellulales bacterium]